ncbi:MAG: ATP-binding cassette domain-containing protein [Parachlamydiaceae bacterium]|nr:ATP-binding cassette domain-containing protein [Parachlamydiaceae bacterium]
MHVTDVSSKTIVEVIELSHDYESHPAVNKISFNVDAGQIFGLLGPNGAGKSTTIKMLTTLLPVSSGTALINGFDITIQAADVRNIIGYVPQQLSADSDLTGYENLLLISKLHGMDPGLRKSRISELLHFMGLNASADQLVRKYSGGMIRRLEIAQALVHNPSILFLDEPSIGLDPSARRIFWEHIKNWQKQFGTTILMTTHNMDEADQMCDVAAFMHLGQIVAIGSPSFLKSTVSPTANLEDVFIYYTGNAITESGDFSHVKQVRGSITNH